MLTRCVILSGGDFSNPPQIREKDFVIACDKGYQYAKQAGIVPDLAVGDFDSCEIKVDEKIEVLRFDSEKDDTDTMIAIKYAIEKGYQEIVLCCSLGGRLDHTIANLQSLVYTIKKGVKISVLEDKTQIFVLYGQSEMRNNRAICLPCKSGFSISLFSYTEECKGITTKGLKYALQDAVLTNEFPLGVSNEWAADVAEVSIKEGILFVILSKLD